MRTSRMLIVGIVALLIGASSAVAVVKTRVVVITRGEVAAIPSQGVGCEVSNSPNGVVCFRAVTQMNGTYSVFISRTMVAVVKNAANHGSRFVYTTKQPKR